MYVRGGQRGTERPGESEREIAGATESDEDSLVYAHCLAHDREWEEEHAHTAA